MATPYRIIAEEDIEPASLQPYIVPASQAPVDGGPLLVVGHFRIIPEIFLKLAAPHPATRRMTEAEFVALLEFVRTSWIVDDVWFDRTGRPIDGFHRVRAGCELLLDNQPTAPVPHRFVEFHDPVEELRWVSARYAGGRELSKKDKRRLVEYLLRNNDNRADAAIAEETKLHRETVRDIRQRLERSGALAFLPVRFDRRGYEHKQQPPGPKVVIGAPEERTPPAKDKKEKLPEQLPQPDLAAPATAQELAVLADLSVSNKAPVEGVDRARRFLPAIAPVWWAKYGSDPITASMLLDLVREQQILCEASDTRAIGYLVTTLQNTERDLGRFRIHAIQYHGMNVRLYLLRPSAWTRHGAGA